MIRVGRTIDDALARTLHSAFRDRMVHVMDQSQHTLADSGGEGAAYEFCQGLDSWEKEREFRFPFFWEGGSIVFD